MKSRPHLYDNMYLIILPVQLVITTTTCHKHGAWNLYIYIIYIYILLHIFCCYNFRNYVCPYCLHVLQSRVCKHRTLLHAKFADWAHAKRPRFANGKNNLIWRNLKFSSTTKIYFVYSVWYKTIRILYNDSCTTLSEMRRHIAQLHGKL